MKTKEELSALKEEVETVNRKLHELTDEELAQVPGGGPIIGGNPKYKIGDWVAIGGFSYLGKEWETGTRVTNIIPEGLVQYELTTYQYDKYNKTVSVTATDILPEDFINPSITPYWANVVTD